MYQSNKPKINPYQKQKKECHFCVNQISDVDYKDAEFLDRFTSSYGKILPTRKTGSCSKHQRKLSLAIKHARIMALMAFVKR